LPFLGIGGAITHLSAPDEIAAACETLINDENLRRQSGDALKTRVATYYTSEIAATAYRRLYKDLAAGAPPGACDDRGAAAWPA
jgi:glycosyltransferase involved in cell wall biosynthesis